MKASEFFKDFMAGKNVHMMSHVQQNAIREMVRMIYEQGDMMHLHLLSLVDAAGGEIKVDKSVIENHEKDKQDVQITEDDGVYTYKILKKQRIIVDK